METLKPRFHRKAWRQDHWVRTHCMWNFKRSRKPGMNEQYAKNSLKHHPLYEAAKRSGDHNAAQQVVSDLLSDSSLMNIEKDLMGRKPLIIVPSLTRYDPNNVIPITFAHILGKELGLDVCDYIYELKGQGRTGQGGIYRLFRQPKFKADHLPAGADFLVADDVCTLGGTLANLVQYIENNEARTIGVTALADGDASPQAKQRRRNTDFLLNATREETIKVAKHYGDEIEQDLKRYAGIDYESLTSREASFLLNATTPELVRAEILQLENASGQPQSKRRGRSYVHSKTK